MKLTISSLLNLPYSCLALSCDWLKGKLIVFFFGEFVLLGHVRGEIGLRHGYWKLLVSLLIEILEKCADALKNHHEHIVFIVQKKIARRKE